MIQVGDAALQRYTESQRAISKARILTIKRYLDCSDATMAKIAGMSRATYVQHRDKGTLDEKAIERLLRVEETITTARRTLSDKQGIQAWLQRPNRSLGDLVPLDMLGNPSGVEAVHDALLRLQYGVYA